MAQMEIKDEFGDAEINYKLAEGNSRFRRILRPVG